MREQRLVFGEDPELYDKARPSYPAELVHDVVEMAGPGARALDVGCGTGKATVLLAAQGLSGVAVEADPSMAAVARRNLASYPRWHVEVSDFEAWEPEGGPAQFDLVCSAQAWHWLDPQVRLHRAHAMLAEGGWLALWWNRPGRDDSAVKVALDRVYAQLAPELPASGLGSANPPALDEIPPSLSFGTPLHRSYHWACDYTAEGWVQALRTQSAHRMFPPQRLEALLSEVESVILAHGGVYHHPYACWLWAVRKQPGPPVAGRTG